MSKLEVAKHTIFSVLDQLNSKDQFGLVLFESDSEVFQALAPVPQSAKLAELKAKISPLVTRGGTNMESGFKAAVSQFEKLVSKHDPAQREMRIIFLTDDMPNTGTTDPALLLPMVTKAAEKRIYSTFYGVGLDFDPTIVEYITKCQGANYYSVNLSY